jgi:hypothetical protein
MPDFTPCATALPAGLSYDICVAGNCVSPGCGSATCNAPGPAWTLADTNQRSCFDSNVSLATCPVMATCDTNPFCGQDAQYGWDVAHMASTRYGRTSGGQPVVVDGVTGLSWMGCADGQTGESCGGTALRSNWDVARGVCEDSAWGGFDDWRLPDRYELQSLQNLGAASGTLIYDLAFPATPASGFWSSSTFAGDTLNAWYVLFNYAWIDQIPKMNTNYVRCVRGLPAPRSARFARSGGTEPVVEDRALGLVWAGCAVGQVAPDCTGAAATPDWEHALDVCQDSRWGGLADWRLPNVFELASLVVDSGGTPAVDGAAFPLAPSGIFWSSTTAAGTPGAAWTVDFAEGDVTSSSKTATTVRARCVRDGP